MSDELYDDLGVSKDATDEEIKKAYWEKAKQHHPDKEGGDAEKMAVVNKAYMVLSDPGRRQKYDDTGATEEQPFNAKFTAFMNQVFTEAIANCPNVNNRDIVEYIKVKVKQMQISFVQSIRDTEKEMHRLDNIKNRLSTKKDKTLIMILKENIRSKKQTIKAIEIDIQFMKDSLEVLQDYNYMVDPVEPKLPNDFLTTRLQGFTFNT